MRILKRRPEWLRLRSQEPPHLWRIGYVLVASFLLAVLGLYGLGQLALTVLHHPQLPHSTAISVHDAVGVAQLVFASVAGAGALVALVVAYRRQRIAETASAHARTRVFNERFTTIAAQLGEDKPAVRLAGVHAMAALADDWEENRQTCVDVLCAYLRMPYEHDLGVDAPAQERLAFQRNREVRNTVIRVVATHLQEDAVAPWHGLDFDFTGVVFDGGDFRGAVFSGGQVLFSDAVFSGGQVLFSDAVFSGGQVSFRDAVFSGGRVYFDQAVFSGGDLDFTGVTISGSEVFFTAAEFSGGQIDFDGAIFSRGKAVFSASFSGSEVHLSVAEFSGCKVDFSGAEFSSGLVSFGGSRFSAQRVDFTRANFCGCKVVFNSAQFCGAEVDFRRAKFSGGLVDFSNPDDWSNPPMFNWDGAPPTGVKLSATSTGVSQ